MTTTPVFVGIDVSKDRLDVALRPTSDRWALANDAPGVAAFSTTSRGLATVPVGSETATPVRAAP